MNNILLSAIAKQPNGTTGINGSGQPLFSKMTLSNGMEIFDFDENLIIQKMEKMMELLDQAL
jgi:hypothetical protein